MHQIPQSDARLHFAFEANQYRLWHVQWHNACGGCESNQTRTCREGYAHRETGVRVTTGTDSIW
jgi:hypothetical protein